jgi:hypothetical protein
MTDGLKSDDHEHLFSVSAFLGEKRPGTDGLESSRSTSERSRPPFDAHDGHRSRAGKTLPFYLVGGARWGFETPQVYDDARLVVPQG